MRAWLCLLALGLLAGCHHDPPPIPFDQDKTAIHPVIPDTIFQITTTTIRTAVLNCSKEH